MMAVYIFEGSKKETNKKGTGECTKVIFFLPLVSILLEFLLKAHESADVANSSSQLDDWKF
ncbi:hypothetical protein Hanom_Chr12g01146781 [Helianthus anomalus]